MNLLTRSLFTISLFLPVQAYAQQAPTPVFVTVVKQQPFIDQIEALGTLKANENVDLTSSVTERVTSINFDDGQRVTQGDVLVEMDSAEEEALLKEEQSRLAEAKRQVARLKPLIDRGATSQSTLDEAELEIQTSKARIIAIQSQINERRVTAPFDGKLGLRNISVGSMAQPGTLVTTIDDDSVMKLDFSIPEIYLPALNEGGVIQATTRAYPDVTFKGTVSSIDSRIDPLTRSISVRALLPNDEHKLKPGMLMRVKLEKNPRQALILPEEALVPKGDKNYVFTILDDGTSTSVKLNTVEIGSRRKGQAEILSGIQDGDQIVTHGTLRLQDGSAVTIKAVETGSEKLIDLLNQKTPEGIQ